MHVKLPGKGGAVMKEAERKYVEKMITGQYDKLMIYAISYLKDPQYAEDAVQELFKRMCENAALLMAHPRR